MSSELHAKMQVMTETVLDPRALNRALLARQHLIERTDALSAEEAITHLVGLQAQAPDPPYYGLWSRLEGFAPETLATLLTERRVARLVLMRGTIHLVTADDALGLFALVAPTIERQVRSNWKAIKAVELEEIGAVARSLLEAAPLSYAQLGEALTGAFAGVDGPSLAAGARAALPLVQVPPRAVWGQGGATRLTTAEHWLGRPQADPPTREELLRRYLAAFGPATVADAQRWSGLTRLAGAVKALRDELVVFRDDHGRELFDLPDAPRPPASSKVPVRLLAEYDNLLLSHADRRRVMDERHRFGVFGLNGRVLGTALVDGFVAGVWRLARDGDEATLLVTPMETIGRAQRRELVAEGLRMLAFAAPRAERPTVRFDDEAGGAD
jgi:hypothetical protein